MKDTANQIRRTVDEASAAMVRMKPDEVSLRRRPDGWSKKEILGHLIDSAANNHQRFVRASYHAAASFPTYDQNAWVRIQQYHASEWVGLVTLWSAFNRHLSDVIDRIPEEAKSSPCNVDKAEPVTLGFLVTDYLRHLQHHVSQILDQKE